MPLTGSGLLIPKRPGLVASRLIPVGQRHESISERILSVDPGALVGYWPLWEQTGTVTRDLSGRGHNGAYTGVSLGQPGVGDGQTSPKFDGATTYANIYSAALAAAFNGSAGTIMAWVKIAAGVWTDGAQHSIVTLLADGSNYILVRKTTTNNELTFRYNVGAVLHERTYVTTGPQGWFHLAMTWDNSELTLRAYLNGEGLTVLAWSPPALAWSGSLSVTDTVIGARDTTPTSSWSGWIAHVALWSKALGRQKITYVSGL